MIKPEVIQSQDNDLFLLRHNKSLDCYDLILKKATYDTSSEVLGLISYVHQLGVNQPGVTIRIGADLKIK